MIHRTLNDANRAAVEMSRFGHCTYTVIALDDGTFETVNGTGRGQLVSRFLNGRKTYDSEIILKRKLEQAEEDLDRASLRIGEARARVRKQAEEIKRRDERIASLEAKLRRAIERGDQWRDAYAQLSELVD